MFLHENFLVGSEFFFVFYLIFWKIAEFGNYISLIDLFQSCIVFDFF